MITKNNMSPFSAIKTCLGVGGTMPWLSKSASNDSSPFKSKDFPVSWSFTVNCNKFMSWLRSMDEDDSNKIVRVSSCDGPTANCEGLEK